MMRLLFANPVELVIFVLASLFILFLVTQIALPLAQGTSMFPMFSRKPGIRRRIASINEQREEEELITEAEQRERDLNDFRESRRANPEQPDAGADLRKRVRKTPTKNK